MRDRYLLRTRWIYIAVLLLFFLIALGVTWPLVTRITSHLPGSTEDTLVHYWNGWWANRALGDGQSPFFTPFLYHPTGLSLVYHNFAWLNIIPWMILSPWMGGFAAYNLSILANLAFCGFAVFLLAQKLTADRRAAFVAGVIYLAWPYRLSQLDHPNLISTQWIPIFVLFLIRVVHSDVPQHTDADAIRREKWRDAVLVGIFLALIGYTRWQLLVPAAVLGGIYLVSILPSQYRSFRYWAPPLLLAAAVAVLALAPPALMLIREQLDAPAELLREDEELSMQTDLLAYLTPSGFHPALGPRTGPAYDGYYADRVEARRFAPYIGVTALALVVLGLSHSQHWRASLPWLVMMLVLILLALGSVLRINGQLYPDIPMPYRLAARLYIVRLLRFPDRFNMFLALPISILSAYGATRVLTVFRKRSRWGATVALCVLTGAILFEYLVIPVPLQRPQVSQFAEQLSTETGDFAVLNLPISGLDSKRYMFAQVTHQHPILQGKTPRFPQGTFDYIRSQPWIKALRESSTMPPTHTDVSRQLTSLAQDGVRYVILHKQASQPLRLHHWRHYFLIPPRFEDELIVVYPTAPLAGKDFTLTAELAPGIGPVQVITPTDCLSPGRTLQMDAGWGTTAPPEADYDVNLALVADDGKVRQESSFALSPRWPTREWPAGALAWGTYIMRVDPSLPRGAYTVTLALTDPAMGAVQGQPRPVGRVVVNETACVFPIPPDAVTVDALFGDALRLMGYQLHQEGDQLTATLHWRAERLMETDYKIFVHVLDPTTGARVAQDDSMPLRWAHRTTYWSAREVVTDAIPLSLENAPAGVYHVVVGVYDSATGERLPVMDKVGQLQPDAQMLLPGSEIKVNIDGE